MKQVLVKMFRFFGFRIERIPKAERKGESLYRKFKDHTMIIKERYVTNLLLSDLATHIKGDIVECGVWKGGMIAGIAEYHNNSKMVFLFDSFEGLPEPTEIDGKAATLWKQDKTGPWYFDNCSADIQYAQQAMKMSGVKSFEIVKGWFSETLKTAKFDNGISILRIDGDWYDSTMECLESLFDYVNIGGIILLDDYFTWEGCSKAVHDYLSKHKRPEILSCQHGVYFIIKK